MRTKLDEIVESFFGTDEKPVYYPGGARTAVRAALDYAFRHGVEQLGKHIESVAGLYVPHVTRDVVQPAPAGEKKEWLHPYKPPLGICVVPGCGKAAHEHPLDRRKGERRKEKTTFGLMCGADGSPGVRIYKIIEGTCLWATDRRSGKDRRKT